jgi:hypothetical protein
MQDEVLDNCLVHQKDHIIDLIDSGKHNEAMAILKFVKELWETASYGYKYNELKERGIRATDDHTGHWKRVKAQKELQAKYRSL